MYDGTFKKYKVYVCVEFENNFGNDTLGGTEII